MSLKITAFSDIHGTLFSLDFIEECEVTFICGDISPLNIQSNDRKMKKWLLDEFKPWCETLPCDKVLFIAGNHDWIASRNPKFLLDNFKKDDKVTYLFHENYIYTSREGKEYSIFGTPFCKKFGNWAFMESDEKLRNLYLDIPNDLDILMCHDQPYGYGDILLQETYWNTGEHIGNKLLLEAVLLRKPKYMLVAHLHSTDHNCVEIKNTKRYNVSLKDEYYNLVYNPLYLDI